MSTRPAIFLDRDGVINQRIYSGYVTRPDEFVLIPGVLEAMKVFARCFDRVFVVTNQQGIGKGLMTEADLDAIHGGFVSEVQQSGGRVDKIYYCPKLQSEHSFMRKPAIGMALQARREFNLPLRQCVMVGDTRSDMLFGRRAGMTTVLVGPEKEVAQSDPHLVDFYYPDLISYAKTLEEQAL